MLVSTIDFFIEEVLRLPIQKALDPNDPHDFAIICAQLAKATKGLAQPEEAKALKAALAALDVDWKSMKADAKAKVVQAAKQAVNPVKAVLPKVEEKFEADALKLGIQTKGSTKKTFGFSISPDLTEVQIKSLQAVAFSQGNYVRDEYGKRSDLFSMKAKQIVAEELAKGTTQKEIAARLKQDLTAQQFNRSQAYWAVVANAFANRARTFVNLSSYQEMGIVAFEVVSVLDERTSQVCRFMHGKRFPVAAALGAYAAAETKGGDVKAEQPWVSQSSDDDGNPILHVNGQTIATVTESGMGKVDETGKFSGAATEAQLQAAGVMSPPFHGHCRTTIVPAKGPRTVTVAQPSFQLTPPETTPPPPPRPAFEGPPAPTPAQNPDQGLLTFGPGPGISGKPIMVPALDPTEPPVQAKAPPVDKIALALEKLAALTPDANGMVPTPVQVKPNAKLLAAQGIVEEAFVKGGQVVKEKKIEGFKVLDPAIDPKKVEFFLKNKKALANEVVHTVKVGAEVYVVKGHEAVAAAALQEKWKVKIKEVNLKELQAELKAQAAAAASAPKAPPIPPKPEPAPTPPPPPPAVPLKGALNPADIMHEKTDRPGGGSNAGVFYRGKDGVERFVKKYEDPSQAHCEVLSNQIYKALGLNAPTSVTWKGETGEQVYASDLVDGAKAGLKPTKAQAKDFFKGFAADVLLTNWDAAGATGDNAFVLKNGQIARIDNGGALLFRAQGDRKSDAQMAGLSELHNFFPDTATKSNPGYHAMAKAAGYGSVEDFKADYKKQVDQIEATRKAYGGWSGFVSQYAPGLTGKDRDAVVAMLEKRTDLLKRNAEELMKPPPPPGQRPAPLRPGPGYQAPAITGVPPKKGLKLSALPETKPPEGANDSTASRSRLPSGEDRGAYQARARKAVAGITPDQKSAIEAFTGSSYGSIRASEEAGRPNASAKAILKSFEKAHPEPGTTYRGVKGIPEALVEQWIGWDHEKNGPFRLGKGNVGATSSTAWHAGVSAQRGMFMGGSSDPSSGCKVLFKIHHKSGVPVETISAVGDGETEVLLSASAEFRVKQSARWEGKKRIVIIELEEI